MSLNGQPRNTARKIARSEYLNDSKTRKRLDEFAAELYAAARKLAWSHAEASSRKRVLELSASLGHASAAADLGNFYLHGVSTVDGRVIARRNRTLARRWLSAAAASGNEQGLIDFAHLLSEEGDAAEHPHVVRLLRRATRKGSWIAAHNLGCHFNLTENFFGAVREFRRAIRLGNPASVRSEEHTSELQ